MPGHLICRPHVGLSKRMHSMWNFALIGVCRTFEPWLRGIETVQRSIAQAMRVCRPSDASAKIAIGCHLTLRPCSTIGCHLISARSFLFQGTAWLPPRWVLGHGGGINGRSRKRAPPVHFSTFQPGRSKLSFSQNFRAGEPKLFQDDMI